MMRLDLHRLGFLSLSAIALTALIASSADAQTATTTTVTTTNIAGVLVDADGVLKMHMVADRTGEISRRRIAESLAKLDPDVARVSPLRKISLNRLEEALRAKLDAGKDPTEEMRYLAGLMKIEYVFFYPETNDIVIAGPAEGWAEDPTGRVLGIESERPVIELADLVVALRAFPPRGRSAPLISCSIDPTKEGLANMQQALPEIQRFFARVGGRPNAVQIRRIADRLRTSLGPQLVTIVGISPDTHFAQVLVEADYRMKLIGIGLERTRVKMKSYAELTNPAAVAKNAMQRWFFVPNYECVRVSDDGLGMELVGEGVKLVGADELVSADGTRLRSAVVDKAGKQFVKNFTDKYPEIAEAVPVYAQLRNCIDLAVAAAYIQKQDYYSQAGWTLGVFGDESQFAVQNESAPKLVESAVACFLRANRLMTPIGGGVRIEARAALEPQNLLADEDEKVLATREEITLGHLREGQWWWD